MTMGSASLTVFWPMVRFAVTKSGNCGIQIQRYTLLDTVIAVLF